MTRNICKSDIAWEIHYSAHYIHTYSNKVKILSSATSLNYLSSTNLAYNI